MTIFSEYAKTWSETVLPLHKPATIITMRSHLSLLARGIGDQPLDMGQPVAQGFFTHQASLRSPKTVRNLYATFRLVLAAALREGLISKLPPIALPRDTKPEQRWLTLEEMQAIIKYASSRYQPLYALLAETGLRIGEALGLQVQDINRANSTLKIARSLYNGKLQTPKSPAARRILTLSPHLLRILEPLEVENVGSAPLFCSQSGHPLWPDKAAGLLHQTMKDLKMEPGGWHAWRRGNATLCCSILGMPEKIAAYRLGHAAPGLTLGRYARSFTGIDKAWAPKIGATLFG